MANSQTTIMGNLADDPELRFTPAGQAVVRIRVAVGDRYYDQKTSEWVDRDPSWYTVNAWRQLAENCAETLKRGDRVIVTGQMRQRSYEKDDETRYVWELEATDVAASLMFASAKVLKATREKAPEREEEDEVSSKRTTRASSSKSTATRSRR